MNFSLVIHGLDKGNFWTFGQHLHGIWTRNWRVFWTTRGLESVRIFSEISGFSGQVLWPVFGLGCARILVRILLGLGREMALGFSLKQPKRELKFPGPFYRPLAGSLKDSRRK